MLASNHSKQVLVIGAGIVGLASAYALQKRNYRITLIDPGDLSDRASSAAACLIGGSAVIPWASATLWREIPSMLLNANSPLKLSVPFPRDIMSFFSKSHRAGSDASRITSTAGLARLGLTGLDSWMALLQDLPEATALFSQTGCYFLYTTPAQREADRANCKIGASFGMSLEELDENDLKKINPDLLCPQATAINVLNAAHVRDPVKLQKILKKAIEKNGGKVIEAQVTDFASTGSRVTSVIVGNENVEADKIVVAAGYGSKVLARKLGSAISLLPCRGFSINLPNAAVSMRTPFLVLNDGYAVTPTDHGLRIAGLVSIGGDIAKQTATARDQLLGFGRTLFGELDTSGMTTNTGVRPLTPDSLPVIDQSPNFDNVYFNFGHGHWGLTQAASSAALLTQLLISPETRDSNNNFRAERF